MLDETKIAQVISEANKQHGRVFAVMAAISMSSRAVSIAAIADGSENTIEVFDEFVSAILNMIHDLLSGGEFTREEFVNFMMGHLNEPRH